MTTQLRTDANNLAGALAFKGTDNVKLTTAGPELLGVPRAPTAVSGTNSTQVATTEFVNTAVQAAGGVVPSTTTPAAATVNGEVGIAVAYARGDHSHPAQNAAITSFVPSGSVNANNVQSAIASLDSSKLPVAGGTVTGNLTVSGQFSVAGMTTHSAGIILSSSGGYSSNSINFNAPGMSDAGVVYGANVPGQWSGMTIQAQGTAASYTFRNNGNAYAPTGWLTGSDERLKSNIANVYGALGKLKQLRGCTFTRIDQDNRPYAGVIAQDVERVLPEGVSVFNHETGHKAVDPMAVIAILIEAVKELSNEVDSLRTRLGGV